MYSIDTSRPQQTTAVDSMDFPSLQVGRAAKVGSWCDAAATGYDIVAKVLVPVT